MVARAFRFDTLRRVFVGGLVTATLALCGCVGLPYSDESRILVPVVVADASPDRAALNGRVYDAAVDWVQRRFYKRDFGGVNWQAEAATRRDAAVAQSDERGFYTALNQTLALLDDAHTRASSPSRVVERRRALLRPGPDMGMTMRIIENQFIVSRIDAGGAADIAGVRPGWRVDEIQGEPVDREALRLKRADTYPFVFTDGDDIRHALTLHPNVTPPFVGQATRRADDIVVLRFDRFDKTTRQWFLAEMDKLAVNPPAGLIIDLRNNSGGLVTDVGWTLGTLFQERLPYARIDVGYLPKIPMRTRTSRHPYDGAVVVLMSQDSASGAEVFAATLQEQGRGSVVGHVSAGAVIASRELDLPDGGGLRIGIRAFRTGAGVVLDKVGVTPDIAVEPTLAGLRAGRDEIMEAALLAVRRSALNVSSEPA